MRLTTKATDRIIVRAGTDCEWYNCNFALIDCGGRWAERIAGMIEASDKMDGTDYLISTTFYENSVEFLDDEKVDSLDYDSWSFVEMDEGEEEELRRPESWMDMSKLVLYPRSDGHFEACGKFSGDEFHTEDFSLRDIVEQILKNKRNETYRQTD